MISVYIMDFFFVFVVYRGVLSKYIVDLCFLNKYVNFLYGLEIFYLLFGLL